jgi:hypothetical protein
MSSILIAIQTLEVGTNNASIIAIGEQSELKGKLKDQAFLTQTAAEIPGKFILGIVGEKNQFEIVPQTSFIAAPLEVAPPVAGAKTAPSGTSDLPPEGEEAGADGTKSVL